MNVIMAYFERAVYGMAEYFKEDKVIVLLLAAFLYLWLKEKKTANNKGNRMLVYSLLMTVLLLFPITAMVFLMYQTAFYDYAWAWSMVPAVAVIAYAVVMFYGETTRKYVSIALILFVFFVCGNQGTLQTTEDNRCTSQAKIIISQVSREEMGTVPVLWGPKNIMQSVRRESGEIRLIYGKDMWDESAGAFDYETYSEDLIEAYEWMELVNMLATQAEGEGTFEMLCEKYDLITGAKEYVVSMHKKGVNVIVAPGLAKVVFDEVMNSCEKEEALEINVINTEQYTVYLLK